LLNLGNQKIHENTDLFCRARFFNVANDKVEDLVFINYGDLQAGSNYSLSSIFSDENSTCELDFLNEAKFNIIKKKLEVAPILIEVFENIDYEELGSSRFNPIYFVENVSVVIEKNNGNEDLKTLKLMGIAGPEVLLKTTICNDNIANVKITVDADGNKVEPPNFNKIVFTEKTLKSILEELFKMNITSPNFLSKGKGGATGLDSTRAPAGLSSVIFSDEPSISIDLVSEKKDLFTIVKDLYNICRSKSDIEDYPYIYLGFDYASNDGFKYDLIFYKNNAVVLDKIYNSDLIKFQETKYNFENSTNSAFAESDKLDYAFASKKRARPNFWKLKEKIESSSPNEGTEEKPILETDEKYIAPLNDKCDEVLSNGTPINETEIEMLFKNKKLFTELHPQQILELINFGDLDGKFRIDKISAVVESTYTSYSLEKITKIK
jgi:hypothetical protein